MKSVLSQRFREKYRHLPVQIRKQAKTAYQLFKQDPYHPSLHFKRLKGKLPRYSARISDDYRVVGVWENDEIIWIWIGTHSEYDKLISNP